MSRLPTALRNQVRARAGSRCEYCCKPEGVSLYPHSVDHIIALKHSGCDESDNLAWACFHCNTGKGSDLASFDAHTAEAALLFNPRKDEWNKHFALDGMLLVGLTPMGRVIVRLLGMNDPDQVEIRRRVINSGNW